MDTITGSKKDESGSKNTLIVVFIFAALAVAGLLYVVWSMPSSTTKVAQLEGGIREGDEFKNLTSKIVVEYDKNRTTQSPTGLGTIQMNVAGIVRNFCGKTITGLELVGSVVDEKGKVVREKSVIAVPNLQDSIEHAQTLSVNVIIDGFTKEDDRANIKWRIAAITVAK